MAATMAKLRRNRLRPADVLLGHAGVEEAPVVRGATVVTGRAVSGKKLKHICTTANVNLVDLNALGSLTAVLVLEKVEH